MPQSVSQTGLPPTIPPQVKAPLITAGIAWKLATIAVGLAFFLGLAAYTFVWVDGGTQPIPLARTLR